MANLPVRELRAMAKERGFKCTYLMHRAKLHKVLGIPPPESSDIPVRKLRVMARELGYTQTHLIRKARLFELLGIVQPPATDLRAIRCGAMPVRKNACELTVIPVHGGTWITFPSIATASKTTDIDRATLAKMRTAGYSHKGG